MPLQKLTLCTNCEDVTKVAHGVCRRCGSKSTFYLSAALGGKLDAKRAMILDSGELWIARLADELLNSRNTQTRRRTRAHISLGLSSDLLGIRRRDSSNRATLLTMSLIRAGADLPNAESGSA